MNISRIEVESETLLDRFFRAPPPNVLLAYMVENEYILRYSENLYTMNPACRGKRPTTQSFSDDWSSQYPESFNNPNSWYLSIQPQLPLTPWYSYFSDIRRSASSNLVVSVSVTINFPLTSFALDALLLCASSSISLHLQP